MRKPASSAETAVEGIAGQANKWFPTHSLRLVMQKTIGGSNGTKLSIPSISAARAEPAHTMIVRSNQEPF